MSSDLRIETARENDIWCIQLTGEFNRNAESDFFESYPWLHQQADVKYVLFDFSGMTYLNSAGIALLIRYVREAKQRSILSCAYGISTHYQKIFKIVGLTHYIEIFQDRYTAVETLKVRSKYETENEKQV